MKEFAIRADKVKDLIKKLEAEHGKGGTISTCMFRVEEAMIDLQKAIDECNPIHLAYAHSRTMLNLEFAVNEKEIDKDTMMNMKIGVVNLTKTFEQKCECSHKLSIVKKP